MQHCPTCGEDKPLDDFPNNRSRPDGKAHICKACQREYVKAYKRKHPEAAKRHARASYERNQEGYAKRSREWERAHPEHGLARGRAYRARKRGAYMEPWTPAEVFEEHGPACIACGEPAEAVDHFYPLAGGGADAPFNLVPMCKPCNSAKQDRDPFEFLATRGIRFGRIVAMD